MRFDSYHPFINLLYFATVVFFGCWFTQPIVVIIGYVCAFVYSVWLNGVRAAVFNCVLIIAIVLYGIWFATNNHFGITNIGETIIGNAYTLESLCFGLMQGTQIATVIMWFTCVFAIFTADKVVYLFGRVSPRAALFLSIILRAAPAIKQRWFATASAQKGIGKGCSDGNVVMRIYRMIRVFSIVLTWSIEHFAQTADSMRNRGATLKGRTAFSIYRFDARDRSVVIAMFLFISVVCMGIALNQTHIMYEPSIIMNPITAMSFVFYCAYICFCLLPLVLEIAGNIRFRRQRSRNLSPAKQT